MPGFGSCTGERCVVADWVKTHETSMAVNFGIHAPIIIGDYAEPRRGLTIIAPGFNPG